MNELIIEHEVQEKDVIIPDNLVFGRTFTSHYFEMDYDSGKGGWYNPSIKKFSNVGLSPAAMVFHYGQAVFEGLKAYKQQDGKIVLFRPEKNFERMNRSSSRMCIPEADIDFLIDTLKKLVKIDKDWIPTKPGHSLYVRPFVIASDPFLGVKASEKYKLMIILSPVGPYYPEGFKPVPIMATDKYVRAVRKGVGDCKTPGNYAASLFAQREAKKEGYTQVLWLDAIEQKYIEEVGTMNIFVRFGDEIVTPPLEGTILPGITRMSVIEMLKDWGMNIVERRVSIDEVVAAYDKKIDVEIFGTGTAAVISSVSRLKYNEKLLTFSDEKPGELGEKLYKAITSIQEGSAPDKYGWITNIE